MPLLLASCRCCRQRWLVNALTAVQPPCCFWAKNNRCLATRAVLPAVDLLDADLDEIVSIERGRIGLYPNRQQSAPAPAVNGRHARLAPAPGTPAAAASQRRARLLAALGRNGGAPLAIAAPPKPVRPPPGEGLNQPALLTFRRMTLRQPADRRTVDAFRGRLLEAAARMGGVFVHYDPDEGVWMLKLDTWL